jgi:hypothetical protein
MRPVAMTNGSRSGMDSGSTSIAAITTRSDAGTSAV